MCAASDSRACSSHGGSPNGATRPFRFEPSTFAAVVGACLLMNPGGMWASTRPDLPADRACAAREFWRFFPVGVQPFFCLELRFQFLTRNFLEMTQEFEPFVLDRHFL